MSLAYLQSFGARRAMAALITGIAILCAQMPAFAQFGGRTATVSVAEASEDVLSIFTDIQGRIAAGSVTAITATVNAVTDLEDLQLGDRVKKGQLVAQQDATDLRNRLALLEAQQVESTLRRDEANTAIAGDRDILALLEEQLALLSGRAERAQTLVSRNALAADAAETAQTAVIMPDSRSPSVVPRWHRATRSFVLPKQPWRG